MKATLDTSSVDRWVAKTQRAGPTLDKIHADSLFAGARVYQGALEASIARATGGDRKLSHAARGRTGTVLGVRVGRPPRMRDTVAALIRPEGRTAAQWAWLERGTKPHLIGVGRGKSLRRGYRSGRSHLRFPDGQVRWGPVYHPGATKTSKPWSKGITAGRPVADRVMQQKIRSGWARTITGGQ